MATTPATPSDPNDLRSIAHPIHTLILIAGEGAIVVLAALRGEQMRAAAELHRIRLYERTIISEWLGFAFVLFGVWLAGSPLTTVVGERWRSVTAVLRDIGIGIVFSVVSVVVLSVLQPHAAGDANRTVKFLLPQNSAEMAVWVLLSLSAGICEETMYRGYLQRQFMAWTKSVPAGVVLSGIAFGLAHAYQGWRMVGVIAVDGMLLGVLARWRGTVRPGMVAHAFKDSVAPLLIRAMKH